MTPLLRFDNVSKDYHADGERVAAIRHLSLEIEEGRFVALMGRSGCGKSTLLNLAGAMDFPTSGNVVIDGASTSGLDDVALTRLRRGKTGFIFQSFQLLANLSVIENIELPLMLAGTGNSRAKAEEALAWVDMPELAARFPHQLSGGQMQRVGIARALAPGPRILLADEPIGNLDSTTGDIILTLLRRIATERRTTILMATHSAESTASCDLIVRMRDGQIQEIVEP